MGVIFIDFRKAFDSVNHEVLSYKRQACGFYGNLLQWLTSYLKNRQQFVDLNGVKSKLQYLSYGVPHGSLLGPRLFSICVNDLLTMFQPVNYISMQMIPLLCDW